MISQIGADAIHDQSRFPFSTNNRRNLYLRGRVEIFWDVKMGGKFYLEDITI